MSEIVDFRIAVLISKESWFVPYAEEFVNSYKQKGYDIHLFHEQDPIDESFDVVFMLSCFEIVSEDFLKKHKHNLVVHESDLPKGKGWAPLFWQVIEGENKIPIVLFEADSGVDSGNIYIKDHIELDGDELHDDIREKQALKTVQICGRFLANHESIMPVIQEGRESCYPKRTPSDSKLDLNKSLLEQFNLLRTVSNEDFPAFFYHKDNKYILKIFKENANNDCR